MLKILHITKYSDGGHWLYLIAREQKENGHDVKVVCPHDYGSLPEKLRNIGVEVKVLPLAGKILSGYPQLFLNLLKLTRYIKKENFDVVQYYLFEPTIIGRIAASIARTPIQVSMCVGPLHLELAPTRNLDKYTAFMDDKIICGCEAIKAHYVELGVPLSKIEVIYLGFNLSHFTSHKGVGSRIRAEFCIANQTPVIGIVAFFYRKKYLKKKWGTDGLKGHEYFLFAAKRVLNEFPNAFFMIVGDEWQGDGSYRRKLHQMALELGIAKNVIFTGFRSDVPAIIDAFDVSVQASLTESVGGAAESLIMEKPLVTTNVGGFPDVVRHKETGLLVPPADSIALANAIIYLLQNRAEAAQMASAGKQLVETLFDIKKTAKKIEQVYLAVAKEKRLAL